ncbi:MAG TPA: DUF5668 domain-containing protein [Anaerolineae bacterium]|nr:DUF5668 domain-containing protein [Anaerolineae bacterium]
MHTPSSRPSLFWPIVLIGVGVIFLLSNLGVITSNPWPTILNLWPVLLIVAGLDILLGRRSAGGLVGAILGLALVAFVLWVLLARPNWPGLTFSSAELKSQRVEAPLGDVQSADVNIDFASGNNRVYALGDSNKLIEGELSYYGDLRFDASASGSRANILVDTTANFTGFNFGFSQAGEKWDVGLNTRPTYYLDLNLGSGGASLDLSRLRLSGGVVDVGSGSVDLTLPASGTFRLQIDGGSGSLRVRLPRDAALRVEIDPGSGAFNPGARLQMISGPSRTNEVYETDGFDAAQNAITLIIDGGSGSINIEE